MADQPGIPAATSSTRSVTRNGGVRRALPADLPPWKTVYDHLRWTADGTVNRIHNSLRDQARAVAGRAATPTAAIADSQSVKAAETVARSSRGYNAGKNVNGRKGHIAVDTTGLLLVELVTAASVPNRHAARASLHALRMAFPTVAKVWVDGGYTSRLVD